MHAVSRRTIDSPKTQPKVPFMNESKRHLEEAEAKPRDFMEVGGSPVQGLTLHNILRGGMQPLTKVFWSPDGKYLASITSDSGLQDGPGNLQIWDLQNGKPLKTIKGVKGRKAAWSLNGQMLAVAVGNIIELRNRADGELLHVFKGHDGEVNDLSISRNGRMIASTSRDKTLRIWDVETRKQRHEIGQFYGEPIDIGWLEDDIGILVTTSTGHIFIVNAMYWGSSVFMSDYIRPKDSHYAERYICMSLYRNILAVVQGGKEIEICDISTRKLKTNLEGHTDRIIGISFSNDGRLLASKSFDNTIRLWRCDTWDMIAVIPEVTARFLHTDVRFSPLSPVLATHGERSSYSALGAGPRYPVQQQTGHGIGAVHHG